VTKHIFVVGAVIVRDTLVLCAQRGTGPQAGLWEFPGGKIEPGETPETALARELAEELGIHVAESALHPLTFVSHAYANFHLVMLLFSCRDWNGTPVGQQGQPLRWEKPDALSALPMPPADVPLLAAIKAFVAVR
jgi:8-oxo-dGTP diphosphatase